jgi:colanic acid biosynthesis glycosyl transferase WcaI
MKILFVHAGYWPYMAATNRALSDLTRYLASQGHEVHVICTGPNPKDPDPAAPTNQATYENVHITRIRHLNIPRLGIHWYSPVNVVRFFLLAGLLTLFWSYRFDIVVTLDLPPGMGIWGTLAQVITFGKTRHVCWLMDFVTETCFILGLWQSDNIRHRLIDYLHILPYRHADLCIVLGECMRDRLANRLVDPAKVQVVGIWHYSDLIQPSAFGELPADLKQDLSGKFIVMYSGHASSSHTFEAIQAAMVALQHDQQIHFIFVGTSKILLDLESLARSKQLTNVTRLDPVDWEHLGSLLAIGHVHLVTLREDMQGICVPSKLYGIMSAGRPSIFLGPSGSQSAIDLLSADAGYVVSPNNSEQLVSILQHLSRNPDLYQKLGFNARESLLKMHDYPIRCHQWENALSKILA